MSDSVESNRSGFRSRERERVARHNQRKKILQQFQQRSPSARDLQSTAADGEVKRYLKIEEQAAQFEVRPSERDSGEESLDMFDGKSEDISENQKPQSRQLAGMERTDEQGYFVAIEGQAIANGKYRVLQRLGKGMFGSVIKAVRASRPNQLQESKGSSFGQADEQQYAIKVIRLNEMMQQSGEREYEILSKMHSRQSSQPQYIMRLFEYFFQKGHLCLVCELMGEDLRSYMKKHQNEITLDSVRGFAIAMFMSLFELQRERVVHADIKPDNFLFSQGEAFSAKTGVACIKLCDFGTAYRVEEHSCEVDELVARYYRAPEIMLGYATSLENRHHLDTWAVACTLYELYTGEFLFSGSSNNEMLKQIMETKGRFNSKIIKNGNFSWKHFDDNCNFVHEKYDTKQKAFVKEKVQISIAPEKELLHRLRTFGRQKEGGKKVHDFKDFLEKCLTLNPKDRMTPKEAFLHPFLNFQVKLD